MKKIILSLTLVSMALALHVHASNLEPVKTEIVEQPSYMNIKIPKNACYVDDFQLPTEVPEDADGAVLLPEFEVTYDPLKPTNLTGQQLEQLAPGMGAALYGMEQDHNVNAVFCLAVGWIESGWKHTANTHNYWGITKTGGGFRAWATLDEAIDGFGAYMNQKMYQGKPIEAVAKIYCPPTWQKWSEDVRATMANYYSEVER